LKTATESLKTKSQWSLAGGGGGGSVRFRTILGKMVNCQLELFGHFVCGLTFC
jgi:hypothetical protein